MLRTLKYFLSRAYTIVSIVLFVLSYGALKVSAIYYPTDNITNPTCAPGDSGCYVSLLPDQTSKSGSLLFSNGNNPSWTSTTGLTWDSTINNLTLNGTNDLAVLGSEMIGATANRDFSSDTGSWTGSNWTIGSGVITHTAGAPDVLTLSNLALTSSPVAATVYQISFTTNTTSPGVLTVSMGGVNGSPVGHIVGTVTQGQNIEATNATELKFTPDSAWAGTIDNISVKVLTPSSPELTIKNPGHVFGLQIRSGGSGLRNVHIGYLAGSRATGGLSRVLVGHTAGTNTQGGNLVFIGTGAGSGHVFGFSNVMIGTSAGASNVTGNHVVFLGTNAGRLGSSVIYSTIIGSNAGYSSQGNSNVFIGSSTGYSSGLSTESVYVGNNAGYSATGSYNTILGTFAGYSHTGNYNVTIGHSAAASGVTYSGANNISIGAYVRPILATGSRQLNIGNVLYGQGLYNGTSVSASATAAGSIGVGSGDKLSRFTVTAPADTTNIGGTTTASSSTTITGVGTTFTTSLGIGDRISLSSASSTYATVTAIASDTSLTVNTALGNGTSQTINLKKSIFRLDDASNVTDFIVNDLGNVGIANSTPLYTLHVGSSSITGIVSRFQNSTGTCDINPTTTSLSCSSDRTLKTNITNLNNTTLNQITTLQPVTYTWINDNTNQQQTGFIAQDVEQIFPSLVSTDPTTNLKSLNYIGLIPYAIEGIKELDIKLNQLSSLDTTLQGSFAFLLKEVLGNVSNGINELYVKVVKSDRVETKELCTTDGICLSENDIKNLYQISQERNQSNPQVAPQNPPAPETPPEEVIPEELPPQENVEVVQ